MDSHVLPQSWLKILNRLEFEPYDLSKRISQSCYINDPGQLLTGSQLHLQRTIYFRSDMSSNAPQMAQILFPGSCRRYPAMLLEHICRHATDVHLHVPPAKTMGEQHHEALIFLPGAGWFVHCHEG